MNKYDIGILTFWNVPNYGTFAQAYALQKVIDSIKSNRQCFQIAYLNKRHYDGYYSRKTTYSPRHKAFYSDLLKRINPFSKYRKKQKMFLRSYNTIPHTERLEGKDFEATYFNGVFLGSDIIWDYSFDMFDNDPFLFGVGINAQNINAYAASFGTIKENKDLPQYVIDGLKKMNHISVRDNNSAKIVEKVLGYRPEIVLDPTYLWDFTQDENIVMPKYKNFMVIYGQDFNELQIEQIIKYARNNNNLLICLDCNDDNYDWCDITIKQYELTPYEWIGFFMYADSIATTTFHGLTFSIIFNKKFAFCKTPFIMDKAGDYLKKIGLYEIFNNEQTTIEEMIDNDWDYKYINSILNKEREKSISFIERCIDE